MLRQRRRWPTSLGSPNSHDIPGRAPPGRSMLTARSIGCPLYHCAVPMGRLTAPGGLLRLDEPDVSVEVGDRGVYVGPEAVSRLFDTSFVMPILEGVLLIHYLTSSMIEVAADGRTARGCGGRPGSSPSCPSRAEAGSHLVVRRLRRRLHPQGRRLEDLAPPTAAGSRTRASSARRRTTTRTRPRRASLDLFLSAPLRHQGPALLVQRRAASARRV